MSLWHSKDIKAIEQQLIRMRSVVGSSGGVQGSAGQAQPPPGAFCIPSDTAEMLFCVTPWGHQALGRCFVTPALYCSHTAQGGQNVPAR